MEILATQSTGSYFDDQSHDMVSRAETKIERISRQMFPDLSTWKKPIQYGSIQGCSGLYDMDLVGSNWEGRFDLKFDWNGNYTAEAGVKFAGDSGVLVEGKVTQEFTSDGIGPAEIEVNVKYDDDQKGDFSEQNRYQD